MVLAGETADDDGAPRAPAAAPSAEDAAAERLKALKEKARAEIEARLEERRKKRRLLRGGGSSAGFSVS